MFFAQRVILSLDEPTLKETASRTNGKYYRAKTVEELNNAYKGIADVSIQKVSFDLIIPLVLVTLLASLTDWFLVNTRHRRIP